MAGNAKGNQGKSFLPLSKELVDIMDGIGGISSDALDVSAVRNVILALSIAESALFCDRCSNPLGIQVKMVPTSDGPILELIIACSGGNACDDQELSLPLWGKDDSEEEEEEDEAVS